MCGIVGFVGRDKNERALDVVMEGLARLEYRGYDSAGVALVGDDHVETAKKAGKLVNLENELQNHQMPATTTAIGHTRWATHGGPTDENAHPHRGGQDGKLALIHNGIIENFHALREELEAEGTTFTSETDTEVVAHLLSKHYAGDLTEALRVACSGRNKAIDVAWLPLAEAHRHLTFPNERRIAREAWLRLSGDA